MKFSALSKSLLLTLSIGAALSLSASAAVVLDVTPALTYNAGVNGYYFGVHSSSSSFWQLDDLSVDGLATQTAGYNPSLQTYTLSLYNNSFGQPGSLILGGIVGTSPTSVITPAKSGFYTWTEDFNLGGLNVTLAPGQSFWYSINTTDPTHNWTVGGNASSSSGWSILGGYAKVSGNYYSIGSTASPGVILSATAIPEPSTYALFGLGALVMVVAHRRRVA